MKHNYFVLTGPTAAGKTDAMLRLASERDILVISADSRQVCRLMDIGTGKPSKAEQAIAPHRVIDVINPGDGFSAHHFIAHAAQALSEARHGQRQVFVCGGTGLYIRALVDSLELGSAPRPLLRKALAHELSNRTPRELAQWLGVSLSEPDNPARVARAVENECAEDTRASHVYAVLGMDEHELAADNRAQAAAGHDAEVLAELKQWHCGGVAVLDPGKAELLVNIETRVASMFNGGLVDEVGTISKLGFGDAGVVKDGIGYREAAQVLDGSLTLREAIDLTIIRTRQYAKRQRTYFSGQGWRTMLFDDLMKWTVGCDTGGSG